MTYPKNSIIYAAAAGLLLASCGPIAAIALQDDPETHPSPVVTQDAYLKTLVVPSGGNEFGSAVALFEDLDGAAVAVVGAVMDDADSIGLADDVPVNGDPTNDRTPNIGAAYIFERPAGGLWEQKAFLKPERRADLGEPDGPGNRIDLRFGHSVAAAKNIVVVGVPSYRWLQAGNRSDMGAICVFRRDQEGWMSEQSCQQPGGTSDDATGYEFGAAVALSAGSASTGSVGHDFIVAGAPGKDANRGAVFLVRGNANPLPGDGKWMNQDRQFAQPIDADIGDRFGSSVAIWQTPGSRLWVAVGAPNEDGDGLNLNELSNAVVDSGAVYVYEVELTPAALALRDPLAIVRRTYLKSPFPRVRAGFGTSLVLDGSTLIVGAPGEEAVWVFAAAQSGVWQFEAKLTAESHTSTFGPIHSLFGSSVALSSGRLLVGAPEDPIESAGINQFGPILSPASRVGSAFLFRRQDSGRWLGDGYIKASNAEAGDTYGVAVAMSGNAMLVGAPKERGSDPGVNGDQTLNAVPNAGACYSLLAPR